MYDRILYPTDGSEPAESVFDYALEIASAHEATIHVLNVADTGRDSLTQRQEAVAELEREGQEIVDEAAQRATDGGVAVVSEVRRGTPSTAIVEYAKQFNVDLVVMPTHGRRGLTQFLVGSVTERVINTAEAPVVSVNPDGDRPRTYPCENLLVPVDGSRGAQLALAEGVAVANATGAALHLLHVVDTGSLGLDARSILKEDELTERANSIVADAVETAETASVETIETEVEYGSPARQIRSYIDENDVDLAVLGTQGVTEFNRYVMGGVSAKLVRTSPIPMMWVREPESDDAA
ncbi:universal stress protein [Haloprofundus sp. MHR1]|uniref:universal stress protein n=1 Tax=Haloprofundus sp. MHR1 TaxID=2572921 RepID=UPI0010BE9F8C|nr:universal stress protein [Haloprofundus sp. MHR1]QCJ45940.1 universal stress protein [Haloprofundus sp. MHR1]